MAAGNLIMQWLQMRQQNQAAAVSQEQNWMKVFGDIAGKDPSAANILYEKMYGQPGPFEVPTIGGKKVTETKMTPKGYELEEVTRGGVPVAPETKEKFDLIKYAEGLKEGPTKEAFKEVILEMEKPERGELGKTLDIFEERGIPVTPTEIKTKTGFVSKETVPAKTVWERFFQLFPSATTQDMVGFKEELARASQVPSTRSMTELENLAGGYFPGKTLKTLSPDERLFLASKLFQLRKLNMLALLLALKGEEGGFEIFERPTKEQLKEIGRKGKGAEIWTDKEENELFELYTVKEKGKLTPEQEKKFQGLRTKRKRLKGK